MGKKNEKYNNPEWIGQKFGRLTVLEAVKVKKEGSTAHWEWICECECGNVVTALPGALVRGTKRSCGCLFHETAVKKCKARANKYPKEENKKLSWKYYAIKKRCYNPKADNYPRYGGRGIKMCDEWLAEFDNFAEWAYSHGYKEGLTIERIDPNGDYCPDNCTFVTLEEQARNKRNTFWVEYHGERMSLAELCERTGKEYHMVLYRIQDMGWSADDAIDIPSAKERYTLAEKCREHGLPYSVVKDRIHKLGWDEERALTTPARHMERKKGQVSQ